LHEISRANEGPEARARVPVGGEGGVGEVVDGQTIGRNSREELRLIELYVKGHPELT
jgi:hypothetical protein